MGIIISISSAGQLSSLANGRPGMICTQGYTLLLFTKMLWQGSPHQRSHSSSNHISTGQEEEGARYGLHASPCLTLPLSQCRCHCQCQCHLSVIHSLCVRLGTQEAQGGMLLSRTLKKKTRGRYICTWGK